MDQKVTMNTDVIPCLEIDNTFMSNFQIQSRRGSQTEKGERGLISGYKIHWLKTHAVLLQPTDIIVWILCLKY